MFGSQRIPGRRRGGARLLTLALAATLAACGGGGGGGEDTQTPVGCSLPERKGWLAQYMDEWYLWNRLVQRPDVSADLALDDYFQALLFKGNAEIPSDRWSGSEPTATYERYYGEGATMGYGLAVAGIEVAGQADQPLYVRLVEPDSDAGRQGVQRGDRVVSLNGQPTEGPGGLVARNDFDLLVAEREGQTLTVVLRNGAGVERTVTLTARIFTLTPVRESRVLTSPAGRRVGYVMINQMISQALAPLDAAFAEFQRQGVQELVLDLRYNGGGLVSTAATVGSYVAGARAAGQTFAALRYNERRAPFNDQVFTFSRPSAAAGLARVYVLTGPRTCSASEQVINALRPFVDVVRVGGTTCGKPVGFLPQSDTCGTTWSAVNFESFNVSNEGRYYDGFTPTCPAPDAWSQPLGAPGDTLLAAAMTHADTGRCPAVGGAPVKPLQWRANRAAAGAEPGERQDMIPR